MFKDFEGCCNFSFCGQLAEKNKIKVQIFLPFVFSTGVSIFLS